MSLFHTHYTKKTTPSRMRRRARRVQKQKPLKGAIMRFLRNASRFLFGRNVLWWLTDSKRQEPGTPPNPSYKEGAGSSAVRAVDS